MSIQQVLAIIWARRLTVLAVFLSTIVVAAIVTAFLPRRYDATATIFVDMGGTDPTSNVPRDQIAFAVQRNYIHTQMEFIRSVAVASRVAEQLGLVNDADWRSAFESQNGQQDIANWIGKELLKQLVIERVWDSDIISVTYKSSSAEKAAKFANAFVETYLRTNLELKAQPARALNQWYEEQLKPLQQKLADAQSRRSELRRQNAFAPDIPSGEEYSKLSNELTTARLGVIQARIALEQAKSGQAVQSDSEEVRQIRRQISDLDVRILRESETLGPTHEALRSWKTSRAALQQQLDRLNSRTTDFEAQLRAAERKFTEVSGALDSYDRANQSQAGKQSQLVSVDAEIDTAKSQIDAMLQRLARSRLASSMEQTPSMLLTPAAVPLAPSFPKRSITLSFAAGLGLLFGLSLGILREMLDRRVRCSEDITRLTSIRLLAIMPKAQVSGSRRSAAFAPTKQAALARPVTPNRLART